MSDSISRIRLDAWPQQATRGHTIPGYRYTSAEFFEKEWEHMWTRVWLLLGRESQLPQPGDWQMEEVGRESILMVRQKDGSVKAFYNICQHRGNPLVDAPKGSTKRFVCRYHSWAYMPDGALNFAPDKEDFPQGDPCKHVRLQELACETFAGFVWVNMNPDCVSLKEFLGPIWDAWSVLGTRTMEAHHRAVHMGAVQLEGRARQLQRVLSRAHGAHGGNARYRSQEDPQQHQHLLQRDPFRSLERGPQPHGDAGRLRVRADGQRRQHPRAARRFVAGVGTRSGSSSKGGRRQRARRCNGRSANSVRAAVTATTPTFRTNSSPTHSTTRCSRISPCRCGRTASTSFARGRTTKTLNSACSTTGGIRARRQSRTAKRRWA